MSKQSEELKKLLIQYNQMKDIAINNEITLNRIIRFINAKLFEMEECESLEDIKNKIKSLLRQMNKVQEND